MPNYMLDAMQGYAFVDNINRRDRSEKLALEDRSRRVAREDKQDARQDTEWGRADQEHADRQAIRDLNVEELSLLFGEDAAKNPAVAAKANSLAKDPARVGEMLAQFDLISDHMKNGKLPPGEITANFMNLAGAEELAARGGEDGLQRKVRSIIPSPKPGEVMMDFDVTDTKSGKTYNAPRTTGASADPADSTVESVPIAKIMGWGTGAVDTARRIAMARAKAGDNSYLDAYKAAKEARRKSTEGLADYEKKKEIDQKYEKQDPVAIGKYGVYDPKTRKIIAGTAGGGLGETWTDENGDEHNVPSVGAARAQARAEKANAARISAVGKVTETAAKHIEKLGAEGDPFLLDIANGLMENRVMQIANDPNGNPNSLSGTQIGGESYRSAKKIYTDAHVQAGKEAAEMRKKRDVWEFDKTTFGGDPEEWLASRAKDIALGKIEGQGKPPAGNTAGQFSPGQTIKQGGKIYVVDDSGVPQEQGGNNGATSPKGGLEKPGGNQKSFLSSPSPSLDLGQALGGLTKGGVKVAKSVAGAVPEVGSFVDAATAATVQAMRPEEVVKFLHSKSSEFAKWWTGASKEQREAFIARSAPSSHN